MIGIVYLRDVPIREVELKNASPLGPPMLVGADQGTCAIVIKSSFLQWKRSYMYDVSSRRIGKDVMDELPNCFTGNGYSYN
jgi:hypothetical protein